MKKTQIILLLLFLSQYTFSQNEELFKRLRAIKNGTSIFYNVDGIEFTKESVSGEFNKKNLRKIYRRYGVKKDIKTINKTLEYRNYIVAKTEKHKTGIIGTRNVYFTEGKNKNIEIYTFTYLSKGNKTFEYKMINLIRNNKIPKHCYNNSYSLGMIDFAGRILELGKNCRWMGISNVQCPYYGQMNWSLHKTIESANAAVENQLKLTKLNALKVISEKEVAVIFEDVPIKAKKVVFKMKGLRKLRLLMTTGEKSLTVYYVSAKVRENFVSCVLSHWDNDVRNPSGLPPLLDSVMRIDNH